MLRAVNGLAKFSDAAGYTGGGLIVDHHHGLDGVTPILAQSPFEFPRRSATPPVPRRIINDESHALGHVTPKVREVPGLEHQNAFARGKRVYDGGFPCSRARRRIDHDGSGSLENRTERFEYFCAQARELRPTM